MHGVSVSAVAAASPPDWSSGNSWNGWNSAAPAGMAGMAAPMTSPMGTPLSPMKMELVERIKAYQKGDPQQKETWASFCGSTKDPARHSVEKLQEFVSSYGVP